MTAWAEEIPAVDFSAEKEEQRAWRANLYALLARLLAAPPGAELLERLGQDVPESGAVGTPFALAWRSLAESARESSAESTAEEYQALFIGVTRGEILPYGSWYLSGFLMEKPLARLRDDLRRLGVARQDAVREPEDHAAAVLETMSLLAADGEARQAEFARTHLLSWLPRFFEDVARAPSARFYRAVAALGAAFMAVDAAYLGTGP
jgi:TorA maturation chaperone TorD